MACIDKHSPVHFKLADGGAWVCANCKKQLGGNRLSEEEIEAFVTLANLFRDQLTNRENEMKVTEIKFTKRYNTGEYQHEEYAVTGSLDKGEDPSAAILELKKVVTDGFTASVVPSEAAESEEDKVAREKAEKKAAKAAAKAAKEAAENEEEEEEEEEENEEESDDDDEEEEEDDEDKEEKKLADKKAAAKKGFKKKGSVYLRTNETHKRLFADKMSELFPKWKKADDTKAKAKKVSAKLDGTDFLDAEGEILESFEAAMTKGMK